MVCHEANRAFCAAHGDPSQKSWNEAADWQRQSAIKGVEFSMNNPDAPASSQHDAWSQDKIAHGWVYGLVKDENAKTHPCLVPFNELPVFQQEKDILFKAIVNAIK